MLRYVKRGQRYGSSDKTENGSGWLFHVNTLQCSYKSECYWHKSKLSYGYSFVWRKKRSLAFHSTKNSGIFETRKNAMEISGESCPRISKTVQFPKCEPFNGQFPKYRNKIECYWNFWEETFENLGIPRKVILFSTVSKKPETCVSFTTGNLQKFKTECIDKRLLILTPTAEIFDILNF